MAGWPGFISPVRRGLHIQCTADCAVVSFAKAQHDPAVGFGDLTRADRLVCGLLTAD